MYKLINCFLNGSTAVKIMTGVFAHTFGVHCLTLKWSTLLLSYLKSNFSRISYCADDKAEKRFFSFIAKEADSDKHTCFVFVSDKLAEEITLTIGQAFDLAYKRFLSGKTQVNFL